MSVFLTGTDTGAGKTTSAAAIMLRYPGLSYWKPVQTGLDYDRLRVQSLCGMYGQDTLGAPERFLEESYYFPAPLSPHRAAELAKTHIDPEKILEDLQNHQSKKGPLLIEGAGGILVPLTRSYTWLDFLKASGLPVLIAARNALGTINHSLLTIELLKSHSIPVLGLLFCGPTQKTDNWRTVEEISQIPVLLAFDSVQEKDFRKLRWRKCPALDLLLAKKSRALLSMP